MGHNLPFSLFFILSSLCKCTKSFPFQGGDKCLTVSLILFLNGVYSSITHLEFGTKLIFFFFKQGRCLLCLNLWCVGLANLASFLCCCMKGFCGRRFSTSKVMGSVMVWPRVERGASGLVWGPRPRYILRCTWGFIQHYEASRLWPGEPPCSVEKDKGAELKTQNKSPHSY